LISVLLPLHYLPPIRSRLRRDRVSRYFGWLDRAYPVASVSFLMLITALVVVSAWMDASWTSRQQTVEPRPITNVESGDWRHIGHDLWGTRFSGLSSINRDNVGKLTRVWEHVEPARAQPHFRLEANESEFVLPVDEAAPLQIDDKLFICLADNTILALDAEDGRLRWRYDPKTDLTGTTEAICRGVAYFDDPTSAQCPKRVLAATLDARLIALDADSGQPCQDFGMDGQISLKVGMGPFPPGMYSPTSPPTITQGLAIIGGRVRDNLSIDEPSGVIRAFDVHSGRLVWAWDMGRLPEQISEPPPGETYTRGTPNSWTFFSSDEALGLVYVPTGNSTPDFVGSYRKPEWEKYSSSIVALDVRTGQVRWSFQTVRHDLWDYDVASQPVLFDMPTESGSTPALVQPTKRGELFVLDRRNGKPLTQIIDKVVPQTDVAGEWTSKTQPFSVGMPSLGGQRLSETDTWGLSLLDQLWCRLRFRHLRYDGIFTPPSLAGSLQFPGTAGGMNWGSVSVDNARHLLFVPSLQMATIIRLVPREAAEKGARYNAPQSGTPFAVQNPFFLTRLNVPCQRPPYALLTAIDLSTKKIVWSRPLGTAEDLGPFGIPSHIPITIGAPPVVGGGIATAGDLFFIGAVRDRRLRAVDSLTGRELWSDKLPQGNQATPITYRAPRSGRQMVVIVSGGYWDLKQAPHGPAHVLAYALP
jgi:membrane-bound PQQ-dependent dehydrogenase (glucose/quinate/shikimate family)